MLMQESDEVFIQVPEDTGRKLIAKNLRRIRLGLGMSQESVSAVAQLHRAYVSNLERCVTNISHDNLTRLANVLQVDLKELVS